MYTSTYRERVGQTYMLSLLKNSRHRGRGRRKKRRRTGEVSDVFAIFFRCVRGVGDSPDLHVVPVRTRPAVCTTPHQQGRNQRRKKLGSCPADFLPLPVCLEESSLRFPFSTSPETQPSLLLFPVRVGRVLHNQTPTTQLTYTHRDIRILYTRMPHTYIGSICTA